MLEILRSLGFTPQVDEKPPSPNFRQWGRFEAQTFEPAAWQPNYESMPFRNRLPDDEFWAAKILMSMTDDDISHRRQDRTVQQSGSRSMDFRLSHRETRQNRRHYFTKVLPLDEFRIETMS